MPRDSHFVALENMYLAAPINEFYDPRIQVSEAAATAEIELAKRFFHSAATVHGSVYFKMLDDAAFFAANSLEREFFVLTTSFTT
jgi:acyl-coenzyme A thioesterase PaaI-like protein